MVHVVLPNVAKLFFKSHNVKSKTDGLDAQMLALLGLERELRLWEPASLSIRQLKGLTRERVAIIEQKTALLNRIEALTSAHDTNKSTIQRLRKVIKLLDEQVKAIEKQIEYSIEKDPVLSEKLKKSKKLKVYLHRLLLSSLPKQMASKTLIITLNLLTLDDTQTFKCLLIYHNLKIFILFS